jgi:hypothetical protein
MAYQKLQVTSAKVVVPNNTTNIDYPGSPDGLLEAFVLYIGTGGNLRVLTATGDDVTFANVLGGTFLPVQVVRVFATGTSATDILALW